jgi:hypothetical protein
VEPEWRQLRHKSLESLVVRNAEDKKTSGAEDIRQLGDCGRGSSRVLEHPPADDGIEVAKAHKVELFDVADELLIGILFLASASGSRSIATRCAHRGMSRGRLNPAPASRTRRSPSVSEMAVEEALDAAQFIILYDARSLVRRRQL